MKKRMFWWIGTAVLLFVCLLLTNLVNIQFVRGEEYATKAANQQLSDISIPANRGTIYDINGKVLAQSGTVWEVNLAPVQVPETQRQLIADTLAEILGLDAESIYQKTTQNVQYARVKGKVESDVAERIRQFISEEGIKGLYLTEDTKRFYPQGTLASSVLGFTGTDNQGLAGIEYWYDSILKGTPGRQISAKNAVNADMPSKYEQVYPAIDGDGLVLSLDQNIQYYLEKYLSSAVEEYGIQQKICGIIMEVDTGKILGMATMSNYDPNQPFVITDEKVLAELEAIKESDPDSYPTALSAAQNKQWRNKAVSDLYEPGSVFKIITAAACLEEQVVTPTEHFNCPGFRQVGVWRYNCHVTTGHGDEDFTAGMGNSCNPVFIEIAHRLGATKFAQYLEAFGFENGKKTGIDLPGEAGMVGHESFTIYDLSSNAFGQTIKVTPLQMITACCAAINGGYLYEPQIVAQMIKDNGSVVETVDSVLKRQVISENTSATLREILKKNVESYGGKNAAVSGYSIGGKSGTSQKLDSEDSAARVASFFAFAPADDPQIAVLIVADEPTIGYRFGSTVCAPLCSKVLADVLPYMGIEPQYTEKELASLNKSVTKVTELTVSEAQKELDGDKFKYMVVGSGDTVVKQMPAAYSTAPEGSTIILYTQEQDPETVEVPNFSGLTYTQTLARARALGLNIKPQGVVNSSGSVAASQSVAYGDVVELGTMITIQFVENDVADF